MTKDELNLMFANASKMEGSPGEPARRAQRESVLLANGYTKKELRKLVKKGILEKTLAAPKVQGSVLPQPLVVVYLLKGETEWPGTSQ